MTRVLALLATLALVGCSDAFDPVAPDGRAFALDAVLDSRDAWQTVRVQDLARPLFDPGPGDARVTLAELRSGRETVLRDSAVTLADGSPGIVFTGPFAFGAGDRLRLRAERDDGGTSEAIVDLPVLTLEVGSAQPTPTPSVPLRLRGLSAPPTTVAVRLVGRRTDTGATATLDVPLAVTFDGNAFPGPTAFLTLGLAPAADALRLALGLPLADPAGRAVLVEATLVGFALSPTPAPVDGGVGGIRWVLGLDLPWRVEPALLAAVRLTDAQAP